jgi:hypothetical protein
MQIGKKQHLHLTYCTNIHPGENWQQVFTNLKQYIPALKSRLSPEKPFGIGLRLANLAARELQLGENLNDLQKWLNAENLYIFTLNGFPYGNFHHQRVKDQVYAPDWSKPERLEYTLNLTQILAEILPVGLEGSISTLPISYKPWFKDDINAQTNLLNLAIVNLAKITAAMIEIRQNTGKLIHLDLEPEPDGWIENTAEVIDFFQNQLIPIGGKYLAQELGINLNLATEYLLEHIRVCYDTCHFAVAYENPILAIQQLQSAGIKIGKFQLSAALKIDLHTESVEHSYLQDKLTPFAESTYLHQVIARNQNNQLHHYSDLEIALPELPKTTDIEWRTHFHVPIFISDYQLLKSTQEDIIAVLNFLQNHPISQHLEIETYTWDVLPAGMKVDLLTSIQREYEWILKNLIITND